MQRDTANTVWKEWANKYTVPKNVCKLTHFCTTINDFSFSSHFPSLTLQYAHILIFTHHILTHHFHRHVIQFFHLIVSIHWASSSWISIKNAMLRHFSSSFRVLESNFSCWSWERKKMNILEEWECSLHRSV